MEVGISTAAGWLDGWIGVDPWVRPKTEVFLNGRSTNPGPNRLDFWVLFPLEITPSRSFSQRVFTPEKLQTPNRKVVFQPPLFRGNVKLRGCNFLFEIGDGSRKPYENEEIRTFCLQFWDTFITQFVNTIEDGQILNCRSPFITQVTIS